MPEVVIIGAGVIGASIAYHLAAAGRRDILLLDGAARSGMGSTGRATGGFRCQFSTPANIALSLLARDKLRRFSDEVGGDAGFDARGYLWIAESEDELRRVREAIAVQHAHGATASREVPASDIPRINGAVSAPQAVGGAFSADDGFIRPTAILDAYLSAAQRLGAKVVWNAHVTGLDVAHDRVVRVRAGAASWSADEVIDAAGPWAASVAALANVELPVTPLRRQVAATFPTSALPTGMPMTIWIGDGFHLRVRDGRVLLLKPSPGATDAFDTSVESAWVDDITRLTPSRIPALRDVRIDRAASWGGLYEMSPDSLAILGRAESLENFWLANGSSGHGVMHAPAIGQLLSEMLTGRPTAVDVAPFSPTRFARGGVASAELL